MNIESMNSVRMRSHWLPTIPAVLVCVLMSARPVFAQGLPTGTISGHVADSTGAVVPGVTITAESPSLQGVRATVSTLNGDYVLPLLPAGQYTISFELSGFRTVKLQQGVAAAQVYPVNVTLAPASVSETVQVVGKSETISQTATASTTLKADLMASLPTNRTFDATVLLAPGAKNTGPNNAISIQGALSYESLFLVNGVVVNENLRGQSLPLYIEDALEETTVMTSGVSAEYGRFAGGVVNAITKSGGNAFSGSFRDSFTNDSWRTLTPYPNDRKVSKTVPAYEGTFGGPIVKDRLWFFGAGRFRDASNGTTGITTATNIPYQYGSDEKRAEGKLTYSPNASNTVRGSYAKVWNTDVNNWYTSAPIMDLASLYTRTTPQDLVSLNYSGILSSKLFVEGQFSQRRFTFSGSGSPYTDPIKGTLLIDQSRGARFWSPTFCGVCTDEHRDNENFIVKGTYFASTPHAGSHKMVFGFDNYRDKRLANNHQSGSDYRIYASSSIVGSGNTLYPVFDNGSTTYIQYNPIPLSSSGNDFQTYSLFYNDSWQYSNRATINLGVRWDRNNGTDQTGATVVKDSAFSPRLGVTIDLSGDGRWVASANYARYVTSIANGIGDSGSSAGNPATYQWYYEGPAINVNGPAVPTAQAIQQVFDWFNANGGPNTKTLPLIGVALPGVDTHVAPNLTSPSVHEVAAGISRQLGAKGAVRADVTYRKFRDFYNDRVDLSTGQVTNAIGDKFDAQIIENTNDVQRQYTGLNVQSNYVVRRTTVGGNYTLSRAWGNFNGESSTGGPSTAGPNFYPEYTVASWNRPVGDLLLDQRHRARLWLNYAIPGDTLGRFDVSVLEQLGSGTPYYAAGLVNSSLFVPASINSQYQTPMGGNGVTYYFTARDAFHTVGEKRTDLALNYGHKIGPRNTEVFAQAQLLNVFNQFQLYNIAQINTTVLTRVNSRSYQAFNPFTTTPVLGQGANWNYGPLFGQAIGSTAYTVPRTFRFSLGVRF